MADSREHPPYGSGKFGRWVTDEFGLPAYLYTASDPGPWHPVGNDRITAVAHAGGGVRLFTYETCAKWLNRSGGQGVLRWGGRNLSTRSADRALFGVGYARRSVSDGGAKLTQTVYAPFGEFPFVVSRADLEIPEASEYAEHWEFRPQELFFTLARGLRGLRSPRIDRLVQDLNMGVVWARVKGARRLPPEPRRRDPWFPDLFVARRLGPPAALEAGPGRHGATLRYPVGPGATRVETAAGYAYAPETVPDLLNRAPSLEETVERWRGSAPRWELPEEWLSREATWSHYCLRSAALYDRYMEAHAIPQGGLYLYRWGINGAPRDLAQHGWPLIYTDPPMAREVLKFLFRLQEVSGKLPWDHSGYGARNLHIMEPSDGGLWLLWFALEYVFATRDFEALDESFPYYPKHAGRSGSGWEHLRAAWRHLRDDIGTGDHGLLRLGFSDWNDEMAPDAGRNPLGPLLGWHYLRQVRRVGESTLNTAMACAVLPGFAEMARLRGDDELAREVGAFVAAQRRALLEQWRGRWFNRAYFDPKREVGHDRLHIEPQIWALLAGIPPEMEVRLLASLREMCIAPSPLGALSLSPARGSLTSRAGELMSGGIWYLLNMLLVEALSLRDPESAWAELKRNTLANHAELYPHLWYGIWSGNDSWNGPASPRPGEAPTGRIPWLNIPAIDYRKWPVQIAHSHGALHYMLLKMAGVGAGPEGYRIRPRLPFPEFAFQGALLGVRYSAREARGYFTPRGSGRVRVEVGLPAGVEPAGARVEADGKPVEAEAVDGAVRFSMDLSAGRRSGWRLSVGR